MVGELKGEGGGGAGVECREPSTVGCEKGEGLGNRARNK